MAFDFAAAMRRAANLTRGGDVAAATFVIQEALAGRTDSDQTNSTRSSHHKRRQHQSTLVLKSGMESGEEVKPSSEQRSPDNNSDRGVGRIHRSPLPRRPLAEVVRLLREGRVRIGAIGLRPGMTGPRNQEPPIPDGAQFLLRSFTCEAGTRSYKRYIPASARELPRGLIVMLHGCRQDPDDFATGTKMHAPSRKSTVCW